MSDNDTIAIGQRTVRDRLTFLKRVHEIEAREKP